QHDLAVPLRDPSTHLAEHGDRLPAARAAAHERDDTEVAREAAAVLHLDEGTDTVERDVAPDAPDGADVTRDRGRSVLAPPRDDSDVLRHARERVSRELRGASRREDATVRAGGASDGLARLPHRLVRDAAGVDDGDVGVLALEVAVREEALADLVGIGRRARRRRLPSLQRADAPGAGTPAAPRARSPGTPTRRGRGSGGGRPAPRPWSARCSPGRGRRPAARR